MPLTTYGAIDVGSSELSMKIYEVGKKKGLTELTHIRHKLPLGAETYKNGAISYSTIDEVCHVLSGFREIMKEYDVTAYNAYTTSGIREAHNNLIILDQIKLQTGLKVKIISNSEQRFLYYKALALKESCFNSMIEDGTLIVDAGAGSVQFSLFDHGCLVGTQNLKLGFARIHELLKAMENESIDYPHLISEYMEKDLLTLSKLFLQNFKIKNIIAVGEGIPELRTLMVSAPNTNVMLTAKEFKKYRLPASKYSELLPAYLLYRKVVEITGCEMIYLSGIDLCDSIVAEYAEKKEKIIPSHDFNHDIVQASRVLATKYKVCPEHISNVENLTLKLFDHIRKIHGLGKRERLLLQIAIILHSCGAFVNINKTRENSYKIIMSTEIIGLSHRERVMIANCVRYNSDRFPKYSELAEELSKDDYITTAKLCALLKVGNVLDKSNRQKIKDIRIMTKENQLIITAYTLADITLEKGLFENKADVFEEVFGLRPILKQKRSELNGKV